MRQRVPVIIKNIIPQDQGGTVIITPDLEAMKTKKGIRKNALWQKSPGMRLQIGIDSDELLKPLEEGKKAFVTIDLPDE